MGCLWELALQNTLSPSLRLSTRKKNKSEIISSIFEFTSLSQKRPARVSSNGKVIDEEFMNGLPTLVVETFPFLAQFCKPKLYKWWPTLVWTISRHQMVGWRRFASATVYNSVCCLEKALEWTKMSSTTKNKTCPTLFKAMTQGISGTWTKLDVFGKVCQTAT